VFGELGDQLNHLHHPSEDERHDATEYRHEEWFQEPFGKSKLVRRENMRHLEASGKASRLVPLSTEAGAPRDALPALSLLEELNDQNPTIQLGDAAFEVSGAGRAGFNGVYLPDPAMENSDPAACTKITWTFVGADGQYSLYHRDGPPGYWYLKEGLASTASYKGLDPSSQCQPEGAQWEAISGTDSPAPTVVRKAAAAYTTTTTTTTLSNAAPSNPTPATQQIYYVVSGAGIQGFNGIYYETSEWVVDEPCKRIWAKGSADSTEYTLEYKTPFWVFASLVNGVTSPKVYFGKDEDGNCNPDVDVTYAALTPTLPDGQPNTVPIVVRSLTATTTTTTTTTTSTPAMNATTFKRYDYTWTTTTTLNTTLAPTPAPTEAPGLSTTNSVAADAGTQVKNGCRRHALSSWLRLLPLAAVLILGIRP
jgi:hypothetical protein